MIWALTFWAKDFLRIIHDLAEGSGLGQYFTKSPIVKYAIGAVSKDRELGDVLDPTCGSGGFLAATPKGTNVFGYDIDTRVVALAYANCLFAHSKVPHIHQMDFLRGVVGRHFDTLVANPPFGVKNVKHTELLEEKELGVEAFESFPLTSTATGTSFQRIVPT